MHTNSKLILHSSAQLTMQFWWMIKPCLLCKNLLFCFFYKGRMLSKNRTVLVVSCFIIQTQRQPTFMKNSHKEVGVTSYLYDEDLWSEFFIKKSRKWLPCELHVVTFCSTLLQQLVVGRNILGPKQEIFSMFLF